MQYPSTNALTPESKDKNTKKLLRAFFRGEISSMTLSANGMNARKEGSSKIVVLKNPSAEILKFVKKEGYGIYRSYRYPGSIEIIANVI